jgi:predicted kinase
MAKKTGYVYVAADDIREEVLGDYRDHSQNERIWAMAFEKIDKALAQGASVLVDGSAITRHHRMFDIEHYRKAGAEKVIGYWFQAPLELALERNHARGSKKIPDQFLHNLYEKLNNEEN